MTERRIDEEATPAPYDALYALRTPAAEERLNRAKNPCEVCGRELDDQAELAMTDQGDYPVGSSCIRKVHKAGIPTRSR